MISRGLRTSSILLFSLLVVALPVSSAFVSTVTLSATGGLIHHTGSSLISDTSNEFSELNAGSITLTGPGRTQYSAESEVVPDYKSSSQLEYKGMGVYGDTLAGTWATPNQTSIGCTAGDLSQMDETKHEQYPNQARIDSHVGGQGISAKVKTDKYAANDTYALSAKAVGTGLYTGDNHVRQEFGDDPKSNEQTLEMSSDEHIFESGNYTAEIDWTFTDFQDPFAAADDVINNITEEALS
jgi:hypothetical protein